MATSTDRGERYTEGEAVEPEACMSLVDFMTDLPSDHSYCVFHAIIHCFNFVCSTLQQKHHPIQTITLPLK